MTEIQQRTEELHQTGQYPNRLAAWQQAMREATAEQTRRHREYIDSL